MSCNIITLQMQFILVDRMQGVLIIFCDHALKLLYVCTLYSSLNKMPILYLYYNSPYLCRCSQTADRNSCSIDSGDVSNCSYCLTVHPVTSSRLSSA